MMGHNGIRFRCGSCLNYFINHVTNYGDLKNGSIIIATCTHCGKTGDYVFWNNDEPLEKTVEYEAPEDEE